MTILINTPTVMHQIKKKGMLLQHPESLYRRLGAGKSRVGIQGEARDSPSP
jgi:hypothetical protein